MAAIAGDYFGVRDDNQFYCTRTMAASHPYYAGTTINHTVNAPTLASQLTDAGVTWKGYFQSLPPTPATLISSGARQRPHRLQVLLNILAEDPARNSTLGNQW